MKQVHLLMTEQLWAKIENEAKLKGQSVSAEIRRVLYEEFGKKNAAEGAPLSRGGD
jgi:hypothetical protein